jgi:DtxR family Mn-dependent transcriptional regulator
VGVTAETAEEDACKMEHHLSEETLKKIKALVKAEKEVPD